MIALFLIYTAYASPQIPSAIYITSVHGDRVVHFDISDKQLRRRGSGLSERSRKLNDKDVEYLAKKVAALPQSQKLPYECQRDRVEVRSVVNGKVSVKQSCFSVYTKTSLHYLRLLNLLARSV